MPKDILTRLRFDMFLDKLSEAIDSGLVNGNISILYKLNGIIETCRIGELVNYVAHNMDRIIYEVVALDQGMEPKIENSDEFIDKGKLNVSSVNYLGFESGGEFHEVCVIFHERKIHIVESPKFEFTILNQ